MTKLLFVLCKGSLDSVYILAIYGNTKPFGEEADNAKL